MTERDRDLVRRFRWAEGQTLRDRPPEKKNKMVPDQVPEMRSKDRLFASPELGWEIKMWDLPTRVPVGFIRSFYSIISR